jgi:hypothetical protein
LPHTRLSPKRNHGGSSGSILKTKGRSNKTLQNNFVSLCPRGKNQSKAQLSAYQKRLISKNFFSFFHIELRESGIENREPFSTQTRSFALLRGGIWKHL